MNLSQMDYDAGLSDRIVKTKYLFTSRRLDLVSEIKKKFPGAYFSYLKMDDFNWSVIVFPTTEDRTLYLLKYGKDYV